MFDEHAKIEVTGNDAERLRGEISIRASRLNGIVESIRDEERSFTLHGQRVFYWIFVINTLKREGRYQEALDLALECVEVADRTLHTADGRPLLWWHIQVVKIAMKMTQYDIAIEALESWLNWPGEKAPAEEEGEATKRLETARKAKARAEGLRAKMRPKPMWD